MFSCLAICYRNRGVVRPGKVPPISSTFPRQSRGVSKQQNVKHPKEDGMLYLVYIYVPCVLLLVHGVYMH